MDVPLNLKDLTRNLPAKGIGTIAGSKVDPSEDLPFTTLAPIALPSSMEISAGHEQGDKGNRHCR